MTITIENETEISFDFDYEALIRTVAEAVLDYENCPYEASLEVVLTDNEGIREVNRDARGIDSPTDVLSFPMAYYESPKDYDGLDAQDDVFDPETGEYLLGSMMISCEKVLSQAEEYGHSVKRELAFLTAHSMLHLLGFDHMEEQERIAMENEQRNILDSLGITR